MVRIDDVSKTGAITKSQVSSTKKNKFGDCDVKFPKATVNDLKELESKSKIGDEKPTTASLKKMGFEKQPTVDANSGVRYTNKSGDTIRISNYYDGQKLVGPEGSSYVTFTSADGKTTQEVVFDPYGEPLYGLLEITDDMGHIDSYSYEYDLNGNKSLYRTIAIGLED
jgi:hypothetical protein